MLSYDELLMLDSSIKNKDKQILRLESIKENTIKYSSDRDFAKRTIVKMIDDVIRKLEKMSDKEYGKILYDVPFDVLDVEVV